MAFDFIIISTLSYLGIYLGAVLGMIAPEELSIGRKYFRILYLTLCLLAISVLLRGFVGDLAYAVGFLIIVLHLVLRASDHTIYPFLALVLSLSYTGASFLTISALIFFAGFPLGSMHCAEFEKCKRLQIRKSQIMSALLKKSYGFMLFCLIFQVFFL